MQLNKYFKILHKLNAITVVLLVLVPTSALSKIGIFSTGTVPINGFDIALFSSAVFFISTFKLKNSKQHRKSFTETAELLSAGMLIFFPLLAIFGYYFNFSRISLIFPVTLFSMKIAAAFTQTAYILDSNSKKRIQIFVSLIIFCGIILFLSDNPTVINITEWIYFGVIFTLANIAISKSQ